MSGVWLVVGVQGAGKSTVAQALAERFDPSVHLRGDQLRRWAVNGWVQPPAGGDDPEARRLLDLRYRLSATIADGYAAAGFTTVVQDNIYGDDVVTWLGRVTARPRHLVVLRPSVETVRRRDAERRATTGKVAYRPGGHTVEDLDAALARTPPVGLWLDTSALAPAETVATILTRTGDARITDAEITALARAD